MFWRVVDRLPDPIGKAVRRLVVLVWPSGTLAAIASLERKVAKQQAAILRLCPQMTEHDGIIVSNRNQHFLKDKQFAAAWEKAEQANQGGWNGQVGDIRWRAHVALWAARHGMGLDGDFVECGVHTGLLSLTICYATDFALQPRKFWLFDTFNGIPIDAISADEMERCQNANKSWYRDVLAMARQNFAPFPNAILVPGRLPQSLDQVSIDRIAYLSMDLNVAIYERQTIERLWDRLVSGAIVLIDDYDWAGHEAQRDSWNEFADGKGHAIVTLPTGQGLLIKH